ncbi:MAG: hypothetical protein LBT24_01410 [Tannerella sp.]|jgi:hypothetical protein|nr:hypothetical protein [Tannerella sp.]
MKEIYLLYSCNAWHSYDSFRLMGVFTNKKALQRYLSGMGKAKMLTKEDLEQLRRDKQTQGKERNYLIEEQEINPKYPGK